MEYSALIATQKNKLKGLQNRNEIVAGLLVKQSLFDGVLGTNANTNFVDFSSKGRSQFIDQLEEFIASQEVMPDSDLYEGEALEELKRIAKAETVENEIDLSEDTAELAVELVAEGKTAITKPQAPQPEEIEQVMNNGLQFLAGLFKMSTGKDIVMESQKIEINKVTGEVTMKFKLPGFGG